MTQSDLVRAADAAALVLRAAPSHSPRNKRDGPRHHPRPQHQIHHQDQRHEGMSHHGHQEMAETGGGMSMAAMTRSMPRSSDGLPMERVQAHFGPLFPGLAGGLDLSLELDGDSVAEANVGRGLMRDNPSASAAGRNTLALADLLGALQPLSPAAYRILAWQALESIAGETPAPQVIAGRIAMLETERAASHLGWLSLLGTLLGDVHLEEGAASLQLATLCARTDGELRDVASAVAKLDRHLSKARLLRRRLAGIGKLPAGGPHGGGPNARAAGHPGDTRTREHGYRAFAFAPVLATEDDALARTSVRVREVLQSLAIASAIDKTPGDVALRNPVSDGRGGSVIESPRGAARLRLTVEHGDVTALSLETPSPAAAALVPSLCREQELADALVSVASLDLSPWELLA